MLNKDYSGYIQSVVLSENYANDIIIMSQLRHTLVDAITPESDLESYLTDFLRTASEVESTYDLAPDKVSFELSFAYHFTDQFDYKFKFFLIGVHQLMLEKKADKENINLEFSKYFYYQLYVSSLSFIYSYIELGAVIYPSNSAYADAIPNEKNIQDKILSFTFKELAELDDRQRRGLTPETYFPIELDQYFFSKQELEHIYRFWPNDGVKSKAERRVYQNSYRDYIGKSLTPKKNESKSTKDKKRLLAFNGWLVGRQYIKDETDGLYDVHNLERGDTWEELRKIDISLFEHEARLEGTLAPTPERFFKTVQKIAKFTKHTGEK